VVGRVRPRPASHCRFAPPPIRFHTTFANILGASFSEATTRANPRFGEAAPTPAAPELEPEPAPEPAVAAAAAGEGGAGLLSCRNH
jgi:hypothetical protein